MLGTVTIDTATAWPGAFLFFLTAAIAICVIGEWIVGRRWGEEPIRWAAVIAAGIFGAVVGSKLYESSLGAWGPALSAGGLPAVHGKNLLGAVAGLRWPFFFSLFFLLSLFSLVLSGTK